MNIELKDLEKAELVPGKIYAIFVDDEDIEGFLPGCEKIYKDFGVTFIPISKKVEIRQMIPEDKS